MLRYIENKIFYDYSHCQQCGICETICPKQAISFRLLGNGTHEVVINHEKCIRCKRCLYCCPANREEDYQTYFNGFKDKRYFLGYNISDSIRRASSSGGVCKTIVIESLKSGWADGVYTLRKTDSFPYAEGEFYTAENIPEYEDIPNSVYHSILACRNINKIRKCKRLIVVGTSCQLRSMSAALKGKVDEIIRICIFCKQQKTLDSTRFLAKIMGTKIPENLNFFVRYRGQGWQGIVRVNESELPYSRAAQLPFGKRLWTVLGCDICGDPFGIKAGADITLMDPWKIRQENDFGETLVIAHTKAGKGLLDSIPGLMLKPKDYKSIETALDMKDIWRKQLLVPYFRGDSCPEIVGKAGNAERWQRKWLQYVVETLPRMPMLFYRVLYKIPDRRNRILK